MILRSVERCNENVFEALSASLALLEELKQVEGGEDEVSVNTSYVQVIPSHRRGRPKLDVSHEQL